MSSIGSYLPSANTLMAVHSTYNAGRVVLSSLARRYPKIRELEEDFDPLFKFCAAIDVIFQNLYSLVPIAAYADSGFLLRERVQRADLGLLTWFCAVSAELGSGALVDMHWPHRTFQRSLEGLMNTVNSTADTQHHRITELSLSGTAWAQGDKELASWDAARVVSSLFLAIWDSERRKFWLASALMAASSVAIPFLSKPVVQERCSMTSQLNVNYSNIKDFQLELGFPVVPGLGGEKTVVLGCGHEGSLEDTVRYLATFPRNDHQFLQSTELNRKNFVTRVPDGGFMHSHSSFETKTQRENFLYCPWCPHQISEVAARLKFKAAASELNAQPGSLDDFSSYIEVN